MENEAERLTKLEMKAEEFHEAIQRLEKRVDEQEQAISNLRADVGKLPPWAATILTALVGTVIAALLRFILQ